MSSNGEQQQGYGSIEAPTITNFEQDHREHNFRQYHNGHPASLQSRSLLFVAVSALIVALYGAAVSFFPFSPTADDILAGTRSACSKGLWKTNSDMDNTKSRYYKHMHVDHDDITSKKTFTSRYFQRDTYWKGPGHPIFVILGGEDPLENLLYPFIYYHLAKQYGAVTIGIEHRFFGESWPIKHPTHNEMAKLLSPKQALEDAKQLIQYKRKELGCSPDRTSANYCPVMTIGGSYPGFLAALMRITYPDIVDIGYAASAPLHLYDHTAAPESYFDKLTAVADKASPGCADAARKTFQEMKEFTLQSSNLDKVAKQLGVCYKHEAIPKYIVDAAENGDLSVFLQELNIIIAAHFAEANMDYYPPGPETELEQWCSVFQQESSMPEKISKFLRMRPDFEICFDMQSELPPGPRARISASDWSGVGSGDPAVMWEFVSCQLIPICSRSNESMFIPREYTMDFVTNSCESRFGYTPNKDALVDQFHFDDVSLQGVTHLLFTNGMNDGWSSSSITEDIVNSGIRTINMINGAHHSDLSHSEPPQGDTDDVKEAHQQIMELIGQWLTEVKSQS